MEVKYLNLLVSHPKISDSQSTLIKTLKGISITEIMALESTYNEGRPFPTALRELLYLAGDYCYVLDTGGDPPQDLQQWIREIHLPENGLTISRPFYAVDNYGGSQFLFVYVDEGQEDPCVYIAKPWGASGEESTWVRKLKFTLSELINRRMERLLAGYNPF